jgi:hypothetical protein
MATIEASAAGGKWSETAAWTGAKVPGEGDDVVLGASSGSIEIAAEAKCRGLNAEKYAKTLTIAASQTLKIGTTTASLGNNALKLSAGMTLTITAATSKITFASTSGGTEKIFTGAHKMPEATFIGVGGIWKLEEQWKSGTTGEYALKVESGTIETNGETVENLEGSGGRIVFAASSIAKLGTSNFRIFSSSECFRAVGTFEGTANVEILNKTENEKHIVTGAGTLGTLEIESDNVTLNATPTVGKFILNTRGKSVKGTSFAEGTTIAVTESFTTNATAAEKIKLKSTVAGKAWKLLLSKSVLVNGLELQDSTAEGTGEWVAAHSTNVSGNTGWKFQETIKNPLAAKWEGKVVRGASVKHGVKASLSPVTTQPRKTSHGLSAQLAPTGPYPAPTPRPQVTEHTVVGANKGPMPALPAETAVGDVLILLVLLETDTTKWPSVIPPAGFTQVGAKGENKESGGQYSVQTFAGVYTGGALPEVEFTEIPASEANLALIAVKNAELSGVVNAASGWSELEPGAKITLPSVTSTKSNCLAIAIAAQDWGNRSGPPPAGWTGLLEENPFVIYTKALPSAEASGTFEVATSGAHTFDVMTLAVAPRTLTRNVSHGFAAKLVNTLAGTVVAFLTTPLRDNFNRGESTGTSPTGTNWKIPPGYGEIVIEKEQARISVFAAASSEAWVAESYGNNQEAYVTRSVLGPEDVVSICMSFVPESEGGTQNSNEWYYLCGRSTVAELKLLEKGHNFVSLGSVPVTWKAGDVMGIRREGNKLIALRQQAGKSAEVLLEVEDTHITTGGFAGIYMEGETARMDNFSAGNVKLVKKNVLHQFAAKWEASGTLARNIVKAFLAKLETKGVLGRSVAHRLTATLSFVGQLSRNTTRLAKAQLTSSVAFGRALNIGFPAKLSFVSSESRNVVHKLLASLSFAGTLRRSTTHALSGSLSFAGSLPRRATKTLTASLSFVGQLGRNPTRTLAASLAPTGSVRRSIVHGISAALTGSGALGKTIRTPLRATLSFTGAIGRTITRPFKAQWEPIGLHDWSFVVEFKARLTSAAVLARNPVRTFRATLAFTGTVRRSITHSLAAKLAPVAKLLARPAPIKRIGLAGRTIAGSVMRVARSGSIRRTGQPDTPTEIHED